MMAAESYMSPLNTARSVSDADGLAAKKEDYGAG